VLPDDVQDFRKKSAQNPGSWLNRMIILGQHVIIIVRRARIVRAVLYFLILPFGLLFRRTNLSGSKSAVDQIQLVFNLPQAIYNTANE
jgi:hypothetical protein